VTRKDKLKALVTGGAGFIGSNFVHLLHEERPDWDVTVLDKLTYAGDKENLEPLLSKEELEFVQGDIQDRETVKTAMQNCDMVFNFAAESHVDRSIQSSKPFVQTNVEGTQTLLDAALQEEVDLFLQVSTDEVYGSIETGSFTEKDRLNPRNPYSATKAAADHLTQSYHITHDLPTVITRSSNNYGPRQHPEKFIPKIITNAANDEEIPVYGDGSNVRDWLYVEDNCRGILTAAEKGKPGETYNVGGGTELTNLQLVHRILDQLDKPRNLITFVTDRKGHDQRYSLDTEKMGALGWKAKTDIERGLKRTMDWYY